MVTLLEDRIGNAVLAIEGLNMKILAVLGIGLLAACDPVGSQMQIIENKVASDAVDQYRIAEREGDKMQICAQAGMVAAAFLQAKNESEYDQWKATEHAKCKLAGVPNT